MTEWHCERCGSSWFYNRSGQSMKQHLHDRECPKCKLEEETKNG